MCAVDWYMFDEIRKGVAERLCDLLRSPHMLLDMLQKHKEWVRDSDSSQPFWLQLVFLRKCNHLSFLNLSRKDSLSHCLNSWPRQHGRSHIMRCCYFQADSFFLTCKVCSFQEGGNRPHRLAAFHCTQFPYSVSCCSQGLTWIRWNSSLNSLLSLQIQSFFCGTQKIIHMNMITYDNRPR